MKSHRVFLGCMALLGTAGACVTRSPKITSTTSKHPVVVAPAKPQGFTNIHPARYVLLDGVGVSYDESADASGLRLREPAIVAGKRLVVEGGMIVESAVFTEALVGFRALPARLGGGYVFWSDETSYHAPTFLGKLTPFATVGAPGGVRPWFDTFVLRSDIGPLEVTPTSFTVRRTELARFSEMLSLDGKIGVRTDPLGHMEASVDSGKTFRPLTFDDGKKYAGPLVSSGNTLIFRRDSSSDWSGSRPDRQLPNAVVLAASGALIPFDPKANDPVLLEPPNSSPYEDPAFQLRFAVMDLAAATATGALVAGNQVVFLRESTLRVFSAKTGQFIQDLQLSIGSQEFGHCQPVTLGEEVFLACTHAAGAHLYALRGTPTTVQLEATFPEPGGFVAGLGQRFLFEGRCGSTPPTVRDFSGYGSSDETPDAGEPDPNTPPPPPPEPPAAPEEAPEKPANEATVCVRLADGTWVERRIEGLKDRKAALFLPGDNGNVTVVVSDKPDADKPDPKPVEGVRFIRIDTAHTKFGPSDFFQPYDSSEPKLRTIARDVWLDEKDGSVHGWDLQLPKTEEQDEPAESEGMGTVGLMTRGRIVGVQIKRDGSVEKYPLPDSVENVVVGGPYALAQGKTDAGPTYYESTDGGRSFALMPSPVSGDFIEYGGGDLEGCSIVGCALGGGLVRLGWGSDSTEAPKVVTPDASSDKPETTNALTSKVFDPHTLVPPKLRQKLHCRLEGKENAIATDKDKPYAVTLANSDDVNVGAVVDHKWTALATTPFDVKPAYPVLFENMDAEPLKGDAIPVLRSTATNPIGLFLRTKEFRFDLSSGPKRKPVGLSPSFRVNVAGEVDRETLVLFDARLGDVLLVQGSTVRPIMATHQIPDVTSSSLTLARRMGAGDDVFAIAIVQAGTGDILLGDLDLGRGTVGPLRLAGNMRKLDTGSACVLGARDYRMVVNEHMAVQFEPADEDRGGLFGSSLVAVGAGKACLEASEMRLVNESTVVVRYSGSGAAGYPAMLHDHGKSLRATCTRE